MANVVPLDGAPPSLRSCTGFQWYVSSAEEASHGLVMHGTVDLGRRDAHAAISVETHLERRPAEMTAMLIGDHSLPCRRWALGALLFVELGHFERLLALPAQLPTSLSHSVAC